MTLMVMVGGTAAQGQPHSSRCICVRIGQCVARADRALLRRLASCAMVDPNVFSGSDLGLQTDLADKKIYLGAGSIYFRSSWLSHNNIRLILNSFPETDVFCGGEEGGSRRRVAGLRQHFHARPAVAAPRTRIPLDQLERGVAMRYNSPTKCATIWCPVTTCVLGAL